ncbi:hypothetical protein [Gorillibacterium sp. sgz5001074]|uniref:hypothetical protein n=1 Tax=Gorillibacterium sp. sgz5001074 TaxID=3446695 RepID=UPI003F66E012
MLSGLMIVLACVIIVLLEVPGILREKRRRELAVFSVLLAMAAGLTIAQALRVPLPNPVDGLIALFSPVYRWVHAL